MIKYTLGPKGALEMRTYYDIHLGDRTITRRELAGEDLVKVGRNHIARTLLELGAATVDPLSPANPLIFSAGPFAGSSFSNANRTSVGCKSPLTGGVKEANGGGTFGYGMGQLKIAGFTLHGASPDWVVLHFKKDGSLDFDDARPYLGKGNFEANRMLLAKYGKKVATALCGPVGEYQGLIAGIAFTDKDLRPSRLAARGGVGAVLGSKKVKAIVLDLDKIPPFADPKKTNASIKDYSKMLLADGIVTNFYQPLGTMGMADVQNQMGGLPVRNFSAGQLADVKAGETFKMGGQFIAPLNTGRGGEQTHACMPGCVIQCSNVYVDASGKEIVSPVEYETLGLLGSNCGLTDPDDLAGLNEIANDMGVDTIETGATLAVLMEAGLGRFGDAKFMAACLREMMQGTPQGRIWAQGTARVGQHYKVRRVPVIKKQAISAYDPRVLEAAGAHQPRRALPRAGRAWDVRAAAGMTLTVDKPAELQQHVGKELGPSDWMTVDQAIIDKFAHATGDHQWIHVDVERAKKEMPGGKTIAHGYLTLALVPRMAQTLVKVTGRKRGLNYGSNKVRFTNAVPAGSRIRLRSYRIRSVEPVDGNGFRVTSEAPVEIEGQERPALVAEIIAIQYG